MTLVQQERFRIELALHIGRCPQLELRRCCSREDPVLLPDERLTPSGANPARRVASRLGEEANLRASAVPVLRAPSMPNGGRQSAHPVREGKSERAVAPIIPVTVWLARRESGLSGPRLPLPNAYGATPGSGHRQAAPITLTTAYHVRSERSDRPVSCQVRGGDQMRRPRICTTQLDTQGRSSLTMATSLISSDSDGWTVASRALQVKLRTHLGQTVEETARPVRQVLTVEFRARDIR